MNFQKVRNPAVSVSGLIDHHSDSPSVWLAILVQFVVNPVVGFTLALLFFWSRLYLRRHDLRETLVGAFLGLLGGLLTAW